MRIFMIFIERTAYMYVIELSDRHKVSGGIGGGIAGAVTGCIGGAATGAATVGIGGQVNNSQVAARQRLKLLLAGPQGV